VQNFVSVERVTEGGKTQKMGLIMMVLRFVFLDDDLAWSPNKLRVQSFLSAHEL
jgi:hypothetical protein